MPRRSAKKAQRSKTAKRTVRTVVEGKPKSRSCGGCTGCCHSMAIPELDKPEWKSCPNQIGEGERGGGCGAYNDRPASCRGFVCLWLRGLELTKPEHRPDRCGIVLVPTDNPRVVQARELWAGAATQGAAAELLTGLRRGGVRVAVTTPVGSRVLQPLTMFGAPVAS